MGNNELDGVYRVGKDMWSDLPLFPYHIYFQFKLFKVGAHDSVSTRICPASYHWSIKAIHSYLTLGRHPERVTYAWPSCQSRKEALQCNAVTLPLPAPSFISSSSIMPLAPPVSACSTRSTIVALHVASGPRGSRAWMR